MNKLIQGVNNSFAQNIYINEIDPIGRYFWIISKNKYYFIANKNASQILHLADDIPIYSYYNKFDTLDNQRLTHDYVDVKMVKQKLTDFLLNLRWYCIDDAPFSIKLDPTFDHQCWVWSRYDVLDEKLLLPLLNKIVIRLATNHFEITFDDACD